jgi:endonuclease/exonuclease/phosphatase family metal-dependent hydrolase
VSDQPQIRVVTLNLLGPANPDWGRRRRVLRDGLQRLDADVVALQEVPLGSAPEVVTDLLGPGYALTGFTRTSKDGVGGALATRSPHRVLHEVDQRTGPGSLPWCATLLVEVDTAVGRVVVAHHKPSWPFPAEVEREAQAVRAARAVEQHVGDAHAVVLGDFDATPDASSVEFLKGRRSLEGVSVCYTDAWEVAHPGELGLTFTADNPLVRAGEIATAVSRRIDYVLVRSGDHGPTLQVLACDRLFDGPVGGMWASDHYGVAADLALPEHLPGSWGTDLTL